MGCLVEDRFASPLSFQIFVGRRVMQLRKFESEHVDTGSGANGQNCSLLVLFDMTIPLDGFGAPADFVLRPPPEMRVARVLRCAGASARRF